MTKQPIWYINSSTGLAVLKNGEIVDWEAYKKCVSEHDINIYLDTPCDCQLCFTQKNKAQKRRPSLNSSEYNAYYNN
jgi:hypothetical protein